MLLEPALDRREHSNIVLTASLQYGLPLLEQNCPSCSDMYDRCQLEGNKVQLPALGKSRLLAAVPIPRLHRASTELCVSRSRRWPPIQTCASLGSQTWGRLDKTDEVAWLCSVDFMLSWISLFTDDGNPCFCFIPQVQSCSWDK